MYSEDTITTTLLDKINEIIANANQIDEKDYKFKEGGPEQKDFAFKYKITPKIKTIKPSDDTKLYSTPTDWIEKL